jgi:hypothetical protein
VPEVRKEGAWEPLDEKKVSNAIEIALNKVSRNESVRRPSRWLKKHLAAFDQFAEKNGRLDEAHSMCFIHKRHEAERVIRDFLIENGLPEMDDLDLKFEACKLARLIQDRCGQIRTWRSTEPTLVATPRYVGI